MRRNRWVAVVALATAGMMAACGGDAGTTDDTATDTAQTAAPANPTPAPTATGTPPEGATQEMVAAGQQIFTGKGLCYSCHGQDGTGTPLAPNLTDGEWINISGNNYDEIQQLVRTGVPNPKEHPGPMPAMGGATLSDQEIQQVAAYVYSLSHTGG